MPSSAWCAPPPDPRPSPTRRSSDLRSACRSSAGRSARRRSCASAMPTNAPRSGTRGAPSSCTTRRRPTSRRHPCCRSPAIGSMPRRDRKSTRLNSSHVAISYAVFCMVRAPARPAPLPYTTLFRSPLGMQIVGRPFGETTILRVGHAYERATEWHTRRPQLVHDATAPDVTPPPVLSEPRDRVDAETRDLCVKAARRAGLQLDDLMLAQLLEGAPYALGMARRLRRDHDPHHEPATVFSSPP